MPIKPIPTVSQAAINYAKGIPPPVDIFAPDVRPDDVLSTPVMISQEPVESIPDNFNELPPEEQQRIKDRMRFRGIRLRGDLPDETIPLSKETMDIP